MAGLFTLAGGSIIALLLTQNSKLVESCLLSFGQVAEMSIGVLERLDARQLRAARERPIHDPGFHLDLGEARLKGFVSANEVGLCTMAGCGVRCTAYGGNSRCSLVGMPKLKLEVAPIDDVRPSALLTLPFPTMRLGLPHNLN